MYINITPHELKIRRKDGSFMVVPTSGVVTRVAAKADVVDIVDGVELRATTFGDLVDLPEPKEGVIYIASLLVAQAAVKVGRRDVVSPGPLLRGEDGNPLGADGLAVH